MGGYQWDRTVLSVLMARKEVITAPQGRKGRKGTNGLGQCHLLVGHVKALSRIHKANSVFDLR